jgi:HsdM N-terminal domain
VITGELKGKIDRIWDAFWSGGISNPIEVIEQITVLLFIRRLDEIQTLNENKARALREPVIRRRWSGSATPIASARILIVAALSSQIPTPVADPYSAGESLQQRTSGARTHIGSRHRRRGPTGCAETSSWTTTLRHAFG